MEHGENEFLKKTRDGVAAPAGFHYMTNGKLMPDADHVAVHGYVDQKIFDFVFKDIDILNEGETRSFSIVGDAKAIFSLEIYDNTGLYYDFDTKVWTAEKAMLKKKEVGKVYNVDIVFAKLPSASIKTYTINLHAETHFNIKTSHASSTDARNADGSVNINNTRGSNSSVLTKVLYQDDIKELRISMVAPSLSDSSSSTIDGATSNTNRIVIDDATGSSMVRVGDLVVSTGVNSHTLVLSVNPDGDNTKEIEVSVNASVVDGAVVTFRPPFYSMEPQAIKTQVGSNKLPISTGESGSFGFSIDITANEGRVFKVLRAPTTNDLCTTATVTFGSAALAIEGEDVSGSTYYRWPITNIANLGRGMVLDPSRSGTGANTTTPALIADYKTTVVESTIKKGVYDDYITKTVVDDVLIGAVDNAFNDVTAVDRNGRITAQAGNIVFSEKQADALKSDAGVRIFGYGTSGIEALTGVGVTLNVTSMAYNGDGVFAQGDGTLAVSTTTRFAVANSTSINLTDVTNISAGMTVRGAGINPLVDNPTVISKSVVSGSGVILVSSAQTIERGQTLFFDGGTPTLTIRGNMEVTNMALNTVELLFDAERFLEVI